MEEKKKRVRPTVAQMKELMVELAKTQEKLAHTERQLSNARSVRNDTVPKKAYEEVYNQKLTLQQSNELMSTELDSLRTSYVELKEDYSSLKEENKRLRNRTLWQRIRNK